MLNTHTLHDVWADVCSAYDRGRKKSPQLLIGEEVKIALRAVCDDSAQLMSDGIESR
ncbi:MAG: hypothetical protein M3371_09015 [Acidobacteriota bacterium]|nr:hypothetical protein [Acidobacteriota bacterium]